MTVASRSLRPFGIFVAGTDTNVGKTVFSAALVRALDGSYWKPVQAGLDDETDGEVVARLSGLGASRVLPEACRLRLAASPHIAAAREGIRIVPDRLVLPLSDRPLVVEGAGGVMVPLTPEVLYIDVLARWRIPVVLCARTTLGTINHTLLSLEALARRHVPVVGVVFIGDGNPEVEDSITTLGRVRRLGCLPRIPLLGSETLRAAFEAAIDVEALESEARRIGGSHSGASRIEGSQSEAVRVEGGSRSEAHGRTAAQNGRGGTEEAGSCWRADDGTEELG